MNKVDEMQSNGVGVSCAKRSKGVRALAMAAFALVLAAACVPGVLAHSSEKADGPMLIAAAAGEPAVYEKTEVVYATLSAAGEPEGAYVVNQFEVTEGGSIVDFGAYEQLVNLTDTREIAFEDGAASFAAEPGVFYYQGNVEAVELPWNVEITYAIDGMRVEPADLAGKSGLLTLSIKTTQNEAAIDSIFFEAFMTQITVTLDGDRCTDIEAEGATIASAGRDRTIAFTALPGQGGEFELTAQVEDFAMGGIQIAALPYSMAMEMPDTDDMTAGIEQLSSAIAQLSDGTSSLAEGVELLADGADGLSSGVSAFGDGLHQIAGSSDELISASAQINEALSMIGAALEDVDLSALEALGGISLDFGPALREAADDLDYLDSVIVELPEAYESAYLSLDAAIASLPSGLSQDEMAAVVGAADAVGPEVGEDARELVAAYEAARAVRAAYGDGTSFAQANEVLRIVGKTSISSSLSGTADLLRKVADLLDSLTAVSDEDMAAQMTQLIEGLQELASNYAQFDEGLGQFASGLDQLAANYDSIDQGVSDYADGVRELSDGANELSGGVAELNSVTIDLPDTMREEIDKMMEDYEFAEFDPISFVALENEHMAAVQFVMTTQPIEAAAVADESEGVEEELTIIDRLFALFD